MKATEFLESQHRKVEQLFKRIEGSRGNKEELVQELADSLAAHMHIEERLFYPSVKSLDKALVMEGVEEHAVARYALRNLLGTNQDDEAFEARVTTLKELIEHHVEEEEDELFPQVRKLMTEEDQRALGAQLKQAFAQVLPGGFGELYGSMTKSRGKRAPEKRRATTRGKNGSAKNAAARSSHPH